MANNYYDATGVLMLERVTPVITALFGGFNLDESYPGNGQAYVARISESNDPQWSDVLENLTNLAAQLDLPSPDDEDSEAITMAAIIEALAKHFDADQDPKLRNLVEHHQFEDSADLEALLLIASCFNDGHNLAAIQFEGCWHCSKPRLFEFGGEGCFLSRELNLFSASSQALHLGLELRQAILAGDLDKAAARIAKETLSLLAGIDGEPLRDRLRRRVVEHLLSTSSSMAPI
ncbi:MAG: hypothetical protein JSS14_02015 [Proteobacteria bacterium]|nr:hypothetical protein [Pseudomonadota bacterium]